MSIGIGSLSQDRSAEVVTKKKSKKKKKALNHPVCERVKKNLIRYISFFKSTTLLIHARVPGDKISSLCAGGSSPSKQARCAPAEVRYITDALRLVRKKPNQKQQQQQLVSD